MMRSLLSRLTLLQQLTLVVAIAVFGLSAQWITARVLRAERRAAVSAAAERLAGAFLSDLNEARDTVLTARWVVQDGAEMGFEVEVRDAGGHVMASSIRPSTPAAGASDRSREPEPRESPSPSPAAFSATASNRLGFRVTAARHETSERAILSALGRAMLLAAIPLLLASILLGRAVVARALRPLSAMAARAATLSAEHQPRSLGERSGLAEIDRLAESFDRLLERLDDALSSERRLTADASHELRTPLTVLSGELELLLEKLPQDAPERPRLASAARQVADMRELVEAVLLLHRSREIGAARAGHEELLNLSDLAREALAEARLRHPERAADVAWAAPDEVLVSGDPVLLASAARNLFDNAFKFTGAGQRVAVAVAETAAGATLTVEDQGPGVRPEERERIFDAFYRGAEARAGRSGFGLGLPILRRVAAAHGGRVEVDDSPLGGARFVLTLPRAAGG